jgi:hypothetical protein
MSLREGKLASYARLGNANPRLHLHKLANMTPSTSPYTQRSCICAGSARNSSSCDLSRAADQRISTPDESVMSIVATVSVDLPDRFANAPRTAATNRPRARHERPPPTARARATNGRQQPPEHAPRTAANRRQRGSGSRLAGRRAALRTFATSRAPGCVMRQLQAVISCARCSSAPNLRPLRAPDE